MNNCDHNFVHLETDYTRTDRYYGNNTYTRRDKFYCSKCLEEKEKVKSNTGYVPDWFDWKSSRIVKD